MNFNLRILSFAEKSEAIDIRTFMPFTGKGYTLGESSKSIRSQTVQNVLPSSPALTKPVPQTSINGILNFTTSSNKTLNQVPSSRLPKISVANTKMFTNVAGSPVKLPFNSRNVASSVTKSEKSSTMTQKRISSEMLTSSQSLPSTSQETRSEGNFWQAPKKPRMDSSQGIKNFFPNVSGVSTTSPKPTINIPCDQPQRPTNQTTSSSQNKKVNCPVCNAEVPEGNINVHLDTCLS